MEKIKKLEDVILSERTLLAEVIKPKRYIISPDGSEDKDSYAKILAVHDSITDLVVGDYVIKYQGNMSGYAVNAGRSDEKTYVIMHRGNIVVAVKPDNFIDPDIISGRVAI